MMINDGAYGRIYELNKNEVIKAFYIEKSVSFIYNFRELDIFLQLNDNDNIIKFKDYSFHPFILKNKKLESINITLEYADYNLLEIFEELPNDKYIYYRQQLLDGVKYIHENNIMHRDLKLENILYIKEHDKLKLCDFGLSERYIKNYEYDIKACTLCYRSPELLLNHKKYDFSVDIFSLGLILYEILYKKTFTDNSSRDKISGTFMKLLTNLPEKFNIEYLKNRYPNSVLLKNKNYCSKLRKIKQVNIFEDKYEEYNQFIFEMIKINPEDRLTLIDSIKDKYIDSIKIDIKIDREDIKEIYHKLYPSIKDLKYFKYNILFSSLDLTYRYIIKSNEYELEDVIISTLYLSIKNYNLLEDINLINNIFTIDDMKKFEELERRIIETTIEKNIGLFRATIYDLVMEDQIDIIDFDSYIINLFDFYINNNNIFFDKQPLKYFYELFKNK